MRVHRCSLGYDDRHPDFCHAVLTDTYYAHPMATDPIEWLEEAPTSPDVQTIRFTRSMIEPGVEQSYEDEALRLATAFGLGDDEDETGEKMWVSVVRQDDLMRTMGDALNAGAEFFAAPVATGSEWVVLSTECLYVEYGSAGPRNPIGFLSEIYVPAREPGPYFITAGLIPRYGIDHLGIAFCQ